MSTSNFKKDLLTEIGNDTIDAVVILSPMDYYGMDTPNKFTAGNLQAGKILSLSEALPLFDYEYDTGYGGMDCHDILMYSKDWIYYIHEYDGSTDIYSMPRNPTIPQSLKV